MIRCLGTDGNYRNISPLYVKNALVPAIAVCEYRLYYPYTPIGTSTRTRVVGGVEVSEDDTGVDTDNGNGQNQQSHVKIPHDNYQDYFVDLDTLQQLENGDGLIPN